MLELGRDARKKAHAKVLSKKAAQRSRDLHEVEKLTKSTSVYMKEMLDPSINAKSRSKDAAIHFSKKKI